MQGVDHYENFPVASWLCPPRLRAPVAAIYHFARTADDLADEGMATPAARLADLAAYRTDLQRVFARQPAQDPRWRTLFEALSMAIRDFALPAAPLHALLDAFVQDVRFTSEKRRYRSTEELLDYCSRSANPVGRLMLHLYGVQDERSLKQSDDICTALQLINFWQDLGLDLGRGRHYLPLDVLHAHGVDEKTLQATDCTEPDRVNETRAAQMVAELVDDARRLMITGAPLAQRMPGRMGWELRLVVLGGLRITDKIQRLGYRTWRERPQLSGADLPVLLWRAGAYRRSLARTYTRKP